MATVREYMTPSKANTGKHVLAWSFVVFYFVLTDPAAESLTLNVIITVIMTMNLMLVFYVVAFIILPITYSKRYLMGTAAFAGLYFISAFFDFLTFNYLMPGVGIIEYVGTYKEIAYNSYRMYIVVCSAAFAYYFNDISIRKIRLHHESEKALMTKEINFLKNQFNSHITFNFLTYCYSRIHNISQETADAIEVFSNMLRYTLTGKVESQVTIDKEIEYIKNFIQLQKLLSERVYVNFNFSGEVEDKTIVHGILIPFIENAFSHGEYNNPESPINITLTVNCQSLALNVHNKKRTSKRIGGTGIGLENVKQLLTIYYPNQFQLTIDDRITDFDCKLHLNFSQQ